MLVGTILKGILYKGICVSELGRYEEAVGTFNELLDRSTAVKWRDLDATLAQALVCKVFCLRELGSHEDAITVCDALLSRFGSSTEPEVSRFVAKALQHKGELLSHLDRRAEAAMIIRLLAFLTFLTNGTWTSVSQCLGRCSTRWRA